MEPRVTEQFEASFVRLTKADGTPVGAGFLVSESHVLTCAHVVAGALGNYESECKTETPQGTIHLDFPFFGAAARTARVEHWQPRTGPSTYPGGDVALLELIEAPPEGARPARLTLPSRLYGRDFRAFGFPPKHDPGVYAYGVLKDRLPNGWLQIEDTKGPGKSVQPGFSGGPVEDLSTPGTVVGMVVMSTGDKVAFAISPDVLARACPARISFKDERHRPAVNTAPPLPPNFVERPEELAKLRQTVIGEQQSATVALTGLRGMGGIGKTVLANALCHDEDVQDLFRDGIVWLRIGREPGNLVGQMKQIGQALGDGLAYYDTPETGADRLRLFLRDKAVLLVLDDVWDARHVEPFIVDAPDCRLLFTTRYADIGLRLGAQGVRLDVLEPEQAVTLLGEWAKRDEAAVPEIAKRLGYLPLALKLAGAQLSDGTSGTEWLETFQRVSQIKLSRRSTDPQENLLISFELSVGQLLAEDRPLYYGLGIFPEDVRVPQSVVTRLWQQLSPELSQFDCHQLVTELAWLALIERNPAEKTITLHDLLRDYTRQQLGDEWAATHNALLSAYNPEGKPWPQIEHDGYLYYHLAYHLREAGSKEELYALLTGSPDWMEAKFAACTGDTAYVADLDLAIRGFTDPLPAPEVLALVKLHTARQVVNARVSVYADTDLRTLVWLGRENEALAHAYLRHEAKDKFNGLLTIYSELRERGQPEPSLLDEAREAASSIADDWQPSDALSTLAKALAKAGDERRANAVFGEAREVASSIADDRQRSEELSTLAKALAQAGRYEEAREVASSIAFGGALLGALSSLKALAQAGRYEEAREVASIIADDWQPSDVLSSSAAVMAQVGRFNYALAVLGPRKLDEFLAALAVWGPSFQQLKPGLPLDVLRDSVRIAGWVRSDWRRIYELLSASEDLQ